MRIVIDIPETDYSDLHFKIYRMAEREGLFDDGYISQRALVFKAVLMILEAIKNGVVLPKGHGRLIDADYCLRKAWCNFWKHEDEMEKKDKDYLLMHRFFEQNGFEVCQQTIVEAPTVLEADKESEEL